MPSCAKRWRAGSITSTPATITARSSTNEIIREALHPYPDDLVIVTKVGRGGARTGPGCTGTDRRDLEQGVRDNLQRLGLDAMEVVNLRIMGDGHGPSEGSIADQVEAMARLQRDGLVRHIGVSNVTAAQVAEARGIVEVACVQNMYNLVHRDDDALVDDLAAAGIAYVPFFPLGGFTPLQSGELSAIAHELGATPMQVALAWLLGRSPQHPADPRHLVAGAPARESGRGRAAAVEAVLGRLDAIARSAEPAEPSPARRPRGRRGSRAAALGRRGVARAAEFAVLAPVRPGGRIGEVAADLVQELAHPGRGR